MITSYIMQMFVLIWRISYIVIANITLAYGERENFSYVLSNSVLHSTLDEAFLICIVWIIVATFLFERMKYCKKVLIVVGPLLLVGIILQIFCVELLSSANVPMEYMPRAQIYFRAQSCEAILILGAMFLWFLAVSKGYIRLWQQIVIPTSLLPIYILFEIIGAKMGGRYFSLGWISVAIVVILASILYALPKTCSKRRERRRRTINGLA